MHAGHLGPEHHADVRAGGKLVDEVARHALVESVATAEDRHAARVRGEEQRRLPCRVARADDMDVQTVGVRCLAAGCAVRDALPDQPVEALDRQMAPRDAAGEDDRPGLQDVAAVEVHLARRSVDPRDRAGDENLRAEPPRLLQAHGSPARRRTPPRGTRGSSRSATTRRPARRALPARPRSSAVPPRPRTPRRRALRARRPRSRCRTRRPTVACSDPAAGRPGSAAGAPRSSRRRPG